MNDDMMGQILSSGPSAISSMVGQIGASPEQTSSGVAVALPMILGALGKNASQPEGAAALHSALQRDHAAVKGLYATYAVPDWVQASIKRHMALYTAVLARAQQGRVELNKHLVASAQERLRDIPIVDRLYGLSLREIDESLRPAPFSVETSLQGGQQGTVVSNHMIPGVFTYEGWKGPFQVAMGRVLEGLGSEAWVVGEPDTKQIDLERGIKTHTFKTIDCIGGPS